MKSLELLLQECEKMHGHMCPGQVLGARMALLGCRIIGVDDPLDTDYKKLIVWIEIDRCMADAIGAVTGVRLGRRSLKYFDNGKVAATFMNIETEKAIRIVALESSRQLADELYSQIANKKERQLNAYKNLPDELLFKVELVKVKFSELDLPGKPRKRVTCELCGEGVNDGRDVQDINLKTLCRGCAFGTYFELLQEDYM